MLGTMTPEPSDPSVVLATADLPSYALPPFGPIILAILLIIGIVVLIRRLRR